MICSYLVGILHTDRFRGNGHKLVYFFSRMRNNPRSSYKLGRISFFLFFFVMVVANCNASCYWLHVLCSQWQLTIWKVLCGELGYCLTRYTDPELVAKCEQIVCMTSCELNERAAKPKFVAQS